MEEALKALLGQGGISGALNVLLILALGYVFKLLQACQDARIADSKAMVAALEGAKTTITAHTVALEARNRILEDVARITTEAARQSETSDSRAEKQLDDISRRIEDLDKRGRQP